MEAIQEISPTVVASELYWPPEVMGEIFEHLTNLRDQLSFASISKREYKAFFTKALIEHRRFFEKYLQYHASQGDFEDVILTLKGQLEERLEDSMALIALIAMGNLLLSTKHHSEVSNRVFILAYTAEGKVELMRCMAPYIFLIEEIQDFAKVALPNIYSITQYRSYQHTVFSYFSSWLCDNDFEESVDKVSSYHQLVAISPWLNENNLIKITKDMDAFGRFISSGVTRVLPPALMPIKDACFEQTYHSFLERDVRGDVELFSDAFEHLTVMRGLIPYLTYQQTLSFRQCLYKFASELLGYIRSNHAIDSSELLAVATFSYRIVQRIDSYLRYRFSVDDLDPIDFRYLEVITYLSSMDQDFKHWLLIPDSLIQKRVTDCLAFVSSKGLSMEDSKTFVDNILRVLPELDKSQRINVLAQLSGLQRQFDPKTLLSVIFAHELVGGKQNYLLDISLVKSLDSDRLSQLQEMCRRMIRSNVKRPKKYLTSCTKFLIDTSSSSHGQVESKFLYKNCSNRLDSKAKFHIYSNYKDPGKRQYVLNHNSDPFVTTLNRRLRISYQLSKELNIAFNLALSLVKSIFINDGKKVSENLQLILWPYLEALDSKGFFQKINSLYDLLNFEPLNVSDFSPKKTDSLTFFNEAPMHQTSLRSSLLEMLTFFMNNLNDPKSKIDFLKEARLLPPFKNHISKRLIDTLGRTEAQVVIDKMMSNINKNSF